MKKKGFIHALVPGHGGVDENGNYKILKEGSKQANVRGEMIYEGQHNRLIADAITYQAEKGCDIKTINLIPEIDDVPLGERVQRINAAYDLWASKGYRMLVWELHLNAFNGNVRGTEIYTTRGQNFSDTMATIWWEEMKETIPDYKTRPDYKDDGDPDKEKNFYVIKKSKAYATLIEFFFFDNPKDVERFMNPAGYHLWAKTVIRAMTRIDTTYDADKLVLI